MPEFIPKQRQFEQMAMQAAQAGANRPSDQDALMKALTQMGMGAVSGYNKQKQSEIDAEAKKQKTMFESPYEAVVRGKWTFKDKAPKAGEPITWDMLKEPIVKGTGGKGFEAQIPINMELQKALFMKYGVSITNIGEAKIASADLGVDLLDQITKLTGASGKILADKTLLDAVSKFGEKTAEQIQSEKVQKEEREAEWELKHPTKGGKKKEEKIKHTYKTLDELTKANAEGKIKAVDAQAIAIQEGWATK